MLMLSVVSLVSDSVVHSWVYGSESVVYGYVLMQAVPL